MLKALCNSQTRSFQETGYLSPIRIMSGEQAKSYLKRLEEFEAFQGSPLKGGQRNKSYLLFPWAYQVLSNSVLLDVVEDLIGPSFVVYHSTTWIKEAQSPGFVSWHQDSTYFGLEPLDAITAWVALSAASEEAGCVRVLPGSHRLGQLPADLRPQVNNLLSSGQTVSLNFDEGNTVPMPLEAGEVSFHHGCTIHGSAGNQTSDRRIGLCLHFVPSHVRPLQHLISEKALCSAMLMRGTQEHPYFPPEAPPLSDCDDKALTEHAEAVARYRAMVQALGHNTASRFD
jgi:non-heme Fe2+,alpha-ketoglutarate-dependent halogenase